MDLKELQKSLETQHAAKVQEINKLNQSLSKAQQELLKIEGAWEIINVQLKDPDVTEVSKEECVKSE